MDGNRGASRQQLVSARSLRQVAFTQCPEPVPPLTVHRSDETGMAVAYGSAIAGTRRAMRRSGPGKRLEGAVRGPVPGARGVGAERSRRARGAMRYWRAVRRFGGGALPVVARQGLMSMPPRRVYRA